MPVNYPLQTNGLLINDAFARFFKENGFLTGVSLDGDEITNDRYRVDKSGNGLMSQILTAVSLLRKRGVAFNILSVIDNDNAADIENAWAFLKTHGFDYLQFIPYVDECGVTSLFRPVPRRLPEGPDR